MRQSSADFGVELGRDFAVGVVNTTASGSDVYGTEALANVSSADAFSALPLAPYLKKIIAGEERPFVKSEAPPEGTFGKGDVHVTVASTFEGVVEEEALDVLLSTFSNKHAALPTLHAVATLFAGVPSIRVAAINASANVMSNRTRYPPMHLPRQDETRIFFAPAGAAGKAAPAVMDEKHKGRGEVDAVELAEFVLKHAKASLEAHPEAMLKAWADVKKQRKAKDKEAAERFPGLADQQQPKKKRRKKARKAKKTKDEL